MAVLAANDIVCMKVSVHSLIHGWRFSTHSNVCLSLFIYLFLHFFIYFISQGSHFFFLNLFFK